MKNARHRKLLAAAAFSIPVFVAAHAFLVDQVRTETARGSKLQGDGAAVPVPAHMSGSVVDLWLLWGLRHALVPSVVQAAGDASMNKAQQESQP